MEMADVLDILADGAHDITLHNLHVIDVVEQLDSRGVHRFDDIHAPGRVVALVVFMVDLAVQELEDDGDTLVFRNLFDAVQSDDAECG